MHSVFFIYPNEPASIATAIETAIASFRSSLHGFGVTSWKQMDIPGRPIVDGVLAHIDAATHIGVDVTVANFNVAFELGYSIARGKRILPLVNRSVTSDFKETTSHIGIFDTLQTLFYSNSTEVVSALKRCPTVEPHRVPDENVNKTAPIYLLETFHKTDASLRITARLDKAKIRYRSFDPTENVRLPPSEAIREVRSSIGVIVNLLASSSDDQKYNNLRCAFVAGLALGFDKKLLILQEHGGPVPIDYRDLVKIYRSPEDINSHIAELAPAITERLQDSTQRVSTSTKSALEQVFLGASSAENEASTLAKYYVQTEEFQRARDGHVNIATGRKGSGKTALFLQLRERLCADKTNAVLDLRPEGYQLNRFKALFLSGVAVGIKEHLVTAFWEYVLLLEVCHRLLEQDRDRQMHDHTIYSSYQRLLSIYSSGPSAGEGDFAERMSSIVNRIADGFVPGELSTTQVTALVYKHDITKLRKCLYDYIAADRTLWILFDNIDKGWPTRGVDDQDILMLKCLLDACRKIGQAFEWSKIDCHWMVFVRNDVFEHLVDYTPDRGKHLRVNIDWTDSDLLREFLRRRLVYRQESRSGEPFEAIWKSLCVSHIYGEDTSEYLLDRALMRPRNLLNLVSYARSSAINMGRSRIEISDIEKACGTYSSDLGIEVGYEIRDVFPEADGLLYLFMGSPRLLSLRDAKSRLSPLSLSVERLNRLIESLLWFSFFGVSKPVGSSRDSMFIYNTNYDMRKLATLAGGLRDDGTMFVIHKAFWPFLEIPSKE